jgi:hypothetical protein
VRVRREQRLKHARPRVRRVLHPHTKRPAPRCPGCGAPGGARPRRRRARALGFVRQTTGRRRGCAPPSKEPVRSDCTARLPAALPPRRRAPPRWVAVAPRPAMRAMQLSSKSRPAAVLTRRAPLRQRCAAATPRCESRQLGTARLPADTNVEAFASSMFQWRGSCSACAGLRA